MSNLLTVAIANYESYEAKLIAEGKPNKFVTSATPDAYKQAEKFLECLTTDGFKEVLSSFNPYCLVDTIKKKYMRKGDE